MKAKGVPQWGIEVKKTLLDKCMTQSELADEMGYSRSYIRQLINGTVNIPSSAEKICNHLGIPFEQFPS